MNPVKNLFKGRLNRRNYLFGFILQSVIFYMLITTFENAWLILFLFFSSMGLSLGSRRLHDIGHSGWFALLLIVPFVGFLFLAYLLLAQGQQTENKYGFPPASSIDFRETLLGVG